MEVAKEFAAPEAGEEAFRDSEEEVDESGRGSVFTLAGFGGELPDIFFLSFFKDTRTPKNKF